MAISWTKLSSSRLCFSALVLNGLSHCSRISVKSGTTMAFWTPSLRATRPQERRKGGERTWRSNRHVASLPAAETSHRCLLSVPWGIHLQWCPVSPRLSCTAGILSRARLCATPGTAAREAPQSMEFSRHECWSGLPSPSPGVFLTQGSSEHLSRHLRRQARSLPLATPGELSSTTRLCKMPEQFPNKDLLKEAHLCSKHWQLNPMFTLIQYIKFICMLTTCLRLCL